MPSPAKVAKFLATMLLGAVAALLLALFHVGSTYIEGQTVVELLAMLAGLMGIGWVIYRVIYWSSELKRQAGPSA